jgi:hypothetical protein
MPPLPPVITATLFIISIVFSLFWTYVFFNLAFYETVVTRSGLPDQDQAIDGRESPNIMPPNVAGCIQI